MLLSQNFAFRLLRVSYHSTIALFFWIFGQFDNAIQIIQTPCTDSTHAMTFAAVTGAGGVLLLYTLVNPLTAELGALNLFLYT